MLAWVSAEPAGGKQQDNDRARTGAADAYATNPVAMDQRTAPDMCHRLCVAVIAWMAFRDDGRRGMVLGTPAAP